MNKEKQRDKGVEKISNEILRWGDNADKTGNYHYALSEHLYDNGYRMASDVAMEIFEEIEKIIDKHYNKHIFGSDLEDTEQEAVMDFSGDVTSDIDELKKKYTEEGK